MNIVSNIADMSNIAVTPLTTEEITGLATCFAGALVDKEMKEELFAFMKNISTTFRDIQIQQREKADEIIHAINDMTVAQKELTKIIGTLQFNNDNNEISQSTHLNDIERKEWITKTKKKVDALRKVYNSNYQDVYNNIYNRMKSEFAHDVYSLFRSSKYNSIIEMCSYSDELMNAMDKCIDTIAPSNNIKRKNSVRSTTDAIDKRMTTKCPANVANAISMNGKAPKGRSFQKAHRILASYFDVDKMMFETKNKYGIKNCSIWFAISQYPDVVNKLERIYKNI